MPANAFAAPPGAVISNQASVNYVNLAGGITTIPSNTVQVTTAVVRSPSGVELTRVLTGATGAYQESVGPAYCFQGGSYQLLADPILSGGTAIDPTLPQEVGVAGSYNLGEPLFLRLSDSDQNLDFQVIDTAVVTVSNNATGDTESVQLSETGPDTGIFSGYIPSARTAPVSGDCILQGTMNSTVLLSYGDPADAGDTSQTTAALDPVSIVFESLTGTIVDGVQVELVNAATGTPATVYGNDGISSFPSSITTGSTVSDSSGASYDFGPGEYRFPVVPNGDYRLMVTPPTDFGAPSTANISDLQLLPGAPYALGPASFGSTFTHSNPLTFDWDIPVDPQTSALFLQKRTLTTVAAPGDFVRYELSLENASATGIATNIRITDQLPPGVRFVPGSVVIDDVSAPDPVISPGGAILQFTVSDLDQGERVSIFYVVEIIGGERNDEIINRASAVANGGLISNEATASIRLTEDLFRSTGTIIGRVIEGDCSQETFGEDQGVANIRIYLEDGRYAISDEGGRFHFEGVEPGTHVAQLDTFSLPAHFDVIGCADNPQYAGRADSQFVKMTRGSLLRTDFYLHLKPPPEGRIDLELRSTETNSAERIGLDLAINGIGNVQVENIDVMVLLPDGVSYLPGTMRVDGADLGEPGLMNGTVSMSLPDQAGNWASHISFEAAIADHINGELSTKAIASFDTPMQAKQRTPVAETRMLREPGVLKNEGYVLDLKFDVLSAELSPGDKTELDRLIRDWRGVRKIQISAVGHSDSTPIRVSKQHLFADNYVLSRARANAAVSYIAGALNVSHEELQVEGRGPDDPVASNETAEGRQKNRRVEVIMSGIRPSKASVLEVTKASSGTQMAETVGAIVGTQEHRRKYALDDENAGMPASQVEPEVESLEPGVSMLLPIKGYMPAIASLKVSIKHAPNQTIELTLNGRPVSNLNFDAMKLNARKTVAISRWVGVDLDDGLNRFKAVIRNADGSKAKTLRRDIDFSSIPSRAEFLPEESTLVADGKTPPVIAVRLFDRSGMKSRPGTIGNFRVSAPHRSQWDVENARQNDLVVIGPREPTYRVEKDGVAYIELAPTSHTGEVTVNLKFVNFREQEVRTWLKPAQRDWILVGFAEGTAGHSTLTDNAVAAADAGHEDGYYDEGRVAFFAKGQIKGEFLLTLAFDSDRDRDKTRDRFQTAVNPNDYYPLYADMSEQRFEASSQRKLYVKLERNQFYALFGDYSAGLSVTDLARYERRFNGVKSEFRGENLGYTVFAAETDQAFTRDEIPGDGTSGLYRLSRAPMIENSDQVRLEVRDRLDSGQVLSTQNMTRFLDYNIDTLNGTIYFKRPVPSRDLEFNPIYIVAEYEAVTDAAEDLVAGGRVSLRSTNDVVEVGVTHINDDTQGAEEDLTGVDFRWQVNDQTLVKAEYAETNSIVAAVDQSGTAHKIELEHHAEKVDVRAYIRQVDDAYGLGYQSAADKGFRRLGVDARGQVGDNWFADGEAMWQQNLLTDDIRNLVRAQLRYERNTFMATAGLTHAEDKYEDGDLRTSDLAEVGLSQKLFKQKLTLRLGGSAALSDDAANTDFPTRIVAGADYRIMEGVDLVAEYEDARGRDIEATMSRLGIRATPWARTQINTSVTNQISEFGPRLFANVGIVQGFQLNERWTFDIGLDQTNTLTEPDFRQFDTDRELVSGSVNDDFFASYLGAMYSAELWSANARVEYRNSDVDERTSLLFGWYRQPSLGHGLSAGLTLFQVTDNSLNETLAADLKFGWAYRMADSKWSFLDRIDLIFEDAVLVSGQQQTWRIINNFNANRRFSAALQMSLQYAFKYVGSDFDGTGYTGYTDLIGVDWRRGFNQRWDMGVNTSVYHSYNSKVVDYGVGIDVGFNVATNMWVTVGYNIAGFYDSDFSEARYTAQGPFLRFSVKADQHALKRIAGRK